MEKGSASFTEEVLDLGYTGNGIWAICWEEGEVCVTHVINMSLPGGGENRVNLACVCNVNHSATHGVLRITNVDCSLGMRS